MYIYIFPVVGPSVMRLAPLCRAVSRSAMWRSAGARSAHQRHGQSPDLHPLETQKGVLSLGCGVQVWGLELRVYGAPCRGG